MDVCSIADASMGMSALKLQNEVGTAVLRKTMDIAHQDGSTLISSLQTSIPPVTNSFDVKV